METTNQWSSFWKKPNHAFNDVMKVSTDFFYRELIKRFPLAPGVHILDYGCGPGLLVGSLVKSDVTVTAADINEHFIEQNKTKFPGVEWIRVSENPKETFELLSGKFAGKSFDVIILLSIVQYFKSKQDVEDVLVFLNRYLKPGGKMIVADVLNENTSSARDAIGAFTECIRRGRTFAFAKFILYLLLSDYSKVSKENSLLLLSADVMSQIALRNSMSVAEEKGMTPHPTRSNYIFARRGSNPKKSN